MKSANKANAVDAKNRAADLQHYADCKDYLYCFHDLTDLCAFCLPGKPLGRTKK